MKICRLCQENKSFSAFGRRKTSRDGYKSECKACLNEQEKRRYADDPEYRKRRLMKDQRRYLAKKGDPVFREQKRQYLRKYQQENPHKMQGYRLSAALKKYGITLQDYEALLENQNYCCAICGEQFSTENRQNCHIDHDHQTNQVRGLLCKACNTSLGHFGDTLDGILKVVAYLTKKEAVSNGFD